jgi:hypothetical protein
MNRLISKDFTYYALLAYADPFIDDIFRVKKGSWKVLLVLFCVSWYVGWRGMMITSIGRFRHVCFLGLVRIFVVGLRCINVVRCVKVIGGNE